MISFRIISTKRLKHLESLEVKVAKFWQVHRWFSGWKDLDIIWDYLIKDTNYGGIEKARNDYAAARQTNEYGQIDPVQNIKNYMDKAYAQYVENNPNVDLSNLTVLISKEDFDVLEKDCAPKVRDDGRKAVLTGYSTHHAPWGFKLRWDTKLHNGQAIVVDL